MRHGFIHLNSDLLFEPELLRALLAAPDENAVIVDRHVSAGQRHDEGGDGRPRILRMGKQLTTDAAAEVVGPAKFGPSGAELLIDRLAELTAGGDRNRWAYSVFGDLAADLALAGVDNPGCFWAEVDTVADAAKRSAVSLGRSSTSPRARPTDGSNGAQSRITSSRTASRTHAS